jgi:hypothetical protein
LSAVFRAAGDTFRTVGLAKLGVNYTLLMWGSLTVFGAVATGRSILNLRAASGVPVLEAATAVAAFLALGASLFALRDPESFEPPAPWMAYLAAVGTFGYLVSLLL